MNRTHFTLTVLLAAVLAAGPGCIKRSIGVRSDPPGALVYLDGLEVGKTPVDGIRFDFYGTRELALYKDGYLVERRVVKISTPWYATFPLDVATDLLNPWDIADRRDYYFALKRTEPAERPAVLRHAHETRETARARIASARLKADYKPRTVVVEDAEKRFFLWGWMFAPPRGEPVYMGEEPAPKEKPKEDPKKNQ